MVVSLSPKVSYVSRPMPTKRAPPQPRSLQAGQSPWGTWKLSGALCRRVTPETDSFCAVTNRMSHTVLFAYKQRAPSLPAASPYKLTVCSEASRISVFQIPVADFSQPRTIILPLSPGTMGKGTEIRAKPMQRKVSLDEIHSHPPLPQVEYDIREARSRQILLCDSVPQTR
jgi:hypothetical protein